MTDEKKQKKTDHQTKVNLGFGISAGEWLIAAGVGLGSGIVAAAAKVRDVFYEELKTRPRYKEAFQEHATNLCNIDLAHDASRTNWKVRARTIGNAKDAFGEKIKGMLEADGIKSTKLMDMPYGTWQRFDAAGSASTRRIAFNGIVGAIIGAAATLSFFNGVASRHKIEQISDALETRQER